MTQVIVDNEPKTFYNHNGKIEVKFIYRKKFGSFPNFYELVYQAFDNNDDKFIYSSSGSSFKPGCKCSITVDFGRHRKFFGDDLYGKICLFLADFFGDCKHFVCRYIVGEETEASRFLDRFAELLTYRNKEEFNERAENLIKKMDECFEEFKKLEEDYNKRGANE